MHILISPSKIWAKSVHYTWQNTVDADSLPTCSVILNVTATQYTCSLSGVYHPPLTSTVKLSIFMHHIPVHSPWLPAYKAVVETVLVLLAVLVLTMAGLFPHRSGIYSISQVSVEK